MKGNKTPVFETIVMQWNTESNKIRISRLGSIPICVDAPEKVTDFIAEQVGLERRCYVEVSKDEKDEFTLIRKDKKRYFFVNK